jgi:thiol-disulfide isomerase/thioredoxin
MQKIWYLFFISFTFVSLNLVDQTDSSSSKLNQVVVDTSIQQEILIGECDFADLMNNSFFGSYFNSATDYLLQTDSLQLFQNEIKQLEIIIVFGSWCSDSQREIPRFYKVLNAIQFPMEKVLIVGVNRQKFAPDIDLSVFQVVFVPTFIFLKNGTEIGRIVESPKYSIESDIVNIIKNNLN